MNKKSTNDNHELPPEPEKLINKWKHSDLPVIDGIEWSLLIPVLDLHESPSSLFEKFLTDDMLQFICNESVRYA